MNTPAHVIINLLCLGRQDAAPVLTPVIIGAILPDAPMFVFYFVEKVVRRTPEAVIWRQNYHQPHWQNFIDLFNSLPLMLLGWVLAAWVGSKLGVLLFTSMALHVLGDLPLHHHDAHRHFFPFSDWRFHSPVSYWDPNHYGQIVTLFEILAVLVGSVWLVQGYEAWPARLSIALVGMLYGAYFVYVFSVWA